MLKLTKSVKALSDETRLRILYLITQRECCVCEVMQTINISQTRASRNLSILHEAGFVKLRKEGLWSHYSIDDDMAEWQASLLKAVTIGLKDSAMTRQDLVNLKNSQKLSQDCCRVIKAGNQLL